MKNFSLTSNLDLLSISPWCSGSRDSPLPWPLCPRMLAGSLPAQPGRASPYSKTWGLAFLRNKTWGLAPLWGKTWGLAPLWGKTWGYCLPVKPQRPVPGARPRCLPCGLAGGPALRGARRCPRAPLSGSSPRHLRGTADLRLTPGVSTDASEVTEVPPEVAAVASHWGLFP